MNPTFPGVGPEAYLQAGAPFLSSGACWEPLFRVFGVVAAGQWNVTFSRLSKPSARVPDRSRAEHFRKYEKRIHCCNGHGHDNMAVDAHSCQRDEHGSEKLRYQIDTFYASIPDVQSRFRRRGRQPWYLSETSCLTHLLRRGEEGRNEYPVTLHDEYVTDGSQVFHHSKTYHCSRYADSLSSPI
jgi:hypothetical protein